MGTAPTSNKKNRKIEPSSTGRNNRSNDLFRKFAVLVSRKTGSGGMLLAAIAVIFGSGFYSNFSDAWRSNAGFGSSVTALVLLFLLQRSQNHSDDATHLKLDELILAIDGSRNETAGAEVESELTIKRLKQELVENKATSRDAFPD